MTRIDHGDIARRAEEFRRQVEERARAQQRGGTPAAPPPETPTPRSTPEDVLEKVPRLFGREIPMDFPMPHGIPIEAPPPDLAPPPVVAEPEPQPQVTAPRTEALPRLASARAQARLDAALDRQELAAALGGVAPPPVVASSVEAGFVGIARPLVGVKQLAWAEKAPGLLKGRLAKLAETASSIEGRAIRAKDILLASAAESRRARTVVGFEMAAGSLEKAAWKAGVAKELAKLVPGDSAASIDRMSAARQQFVEVQAHAGEAKTALRDLAPNAPETPWALQEIRSLQQEAGGARWESARTEATGELLQEMDAGEGLLTEGAPEAGQESLPGAEFEFGEADLARIGTALDPSKPAAQANWADHMINTVCELGRQQGGITDEQGGRNFELARTVLAGGDSPEAKELGAADLAAVLKMSGVDLAKVDPNQLQSASSYVSKATTLEEQQQRLRKALDTFQVLEKTGLPKMSRAQMMDELWNVAKVPKHALEKLKDKELTQKFQEVLATVNAGPGQSEIKIGKHNLKLTVGEGGTVKKSSCKKPSFFSQVVKITKIITPIALTVLSFIPVTAPFALVAQGAISMYNAIKAKSLLGIATAAASLAGGAGAIVGRFAGAASKAAQAAGRVAQATKAARTAATAAKVVRVASSAGRALQGISSLKSGNLVGGLANIGGAIASGIGTFANGASSGLGKVADNLNRVSTKLSAVGTGVASFQGYKQASQALSEAKGALEAAKASGNPRAIADAEKRVSQAESQKRAALIGGAAGAASAASALMENRSLFEGQSEEKRPAQTPLQSRLRLASQGLGMAQSVAGKDYAGAAVAALSFGSTIRSAQKDGQENRLNHAANMAQAGLGYYQAEKGRSGANKAVTEAQRHLDAARVRGHSEEIRQAEANLKSARKSAESALMGGIAAGESLLATARDIGDQYRKEKAKKEESTTLQGLFTAAQTSVQAGQKKEEALAAIVNDRTMPLDLREAALAEHGRLRQEGAKLDKAIKESKGDPAKVQAAKNAYDEAVNTADGRLNQLTRLASTARTAPSPTSSPTAPGDGPTGLASMRRPQNIAAAKVTKGITVWEVSQRTGVPVDRILEFNAQSGNPLVPENLQIGQQILIPMDPEDIKFKPLTAEQVHDLKVKANEERRLASITVPPLRSPEEGIPVPDTPRSRLQRSVAQDRALIAEDEKSAEFKPLDPSTWVDNKEEKTRTQARNTLKEAVDRLDRVLNDPTSTDAQIHEAVADKTTALSFYSSARSKAYDSNERTDFLTPAKEVLKGVQTVARDAGRAAADKIANLGLPEAVIFTTTLPIEMVTVVADAALQFPIGAVTMAQGIAGAIAHPINTAAGVVHLIDRTAQTTPEGRTFEFMAELALGKYKTADEAFRAFREKTDGGALLEAKIDLAKDLGAGFFEESIKLAKEGRYAAAFTNLFGENADLLLGMGPVRNLGKLERPVQVASEAEKAAKAAADAARAVDEATKAARTVEPGALERTSAGIEQSKIAPKSSSGAKGTERIQRLSRSGFATFEGIEVRGMRELSHVPESTLKAMKEYGFAATDAKGNRLILHHLKQNAKGPVVEMPAKNHSIGNPRQHPLGNAAGVGLTAEQRAAANAWRIEYWKARAAEELARRGRQ